VGKPDLDPVLNALPGRIVDERYRVDDLMGVGAMGAVFRGMHLALQRPVAVKVLHPHLARHPDVAARFEREARSASRLDHPNVIRVLDSGTTEDGLGYLVMELLQGHDLRAWLGRALHPRAAIDIMLQILAALDHAHKQGVVHRDLKPENIYVTAGPNDAAVLKLLDFGVARIVRGASKRDQITIGPTVTGTPDYMSPEQTVGGAPDARTDLYSAGIIFYELLVGERPFKDPDPALLMRQQLLMSPPPLPAHVPPALVSVVERMLEKERDNRYSSATEIIGLLQRVRAELTG
jgi:serine/threonine protein kinase